MRTTTKTWLRAVAVLELLLLCTVCSAQEGFVLNDVPAKKKVEVRYNGELVTAYCYFDSTEKPILFPLKTLSGITVTRGFPIAPREGERTDHPHHTGIWFNYESVNGLDFWNNSYAIPQDKKDHYGSIRHQKVLNKTGGKNAASLTTMSHWVDPNNSVLLEEVTVFNFYARGDKFIIDRLCSLKAISGDVSFKDVKDGLIAIRVARSLEMPSTQKDKFVSANGVETTLESINNDGVTGMYVNRQGVTGDSVWSSRSEWAQLYGQVASRDVAIAIVDHPVNPGYPTYWHARGYGLFSANPLGKKIFSKNKEEMNFVLMKGRTVAFAYRFVIRDGKQFTKAELDAIAEDFAKVKKRL